MTESVTGAGEDWYLVYEEPADVEGAEVIQPHKTHFKRRLTDAAYLHFLLSAQGRDVHLRVSQNKGRQEFVDPTALGVAFYHSVEKWISGYPQHVREDLPPREYRRPYYVVYVSPTYPMAESGAAECMAVFTQSSPAAAEIKENGGLLKSIDLPAAKRHAAYFKYKCGLMGKEASVHRQRGGCSTALHDEDIQEALEYLAIRVQGKKRRCRDKVRLSSRLAHSRARR